MSRNSSLQRRIPSVDTLLRGESARKLIQLAGRELAVEACRYATAELRRQFAEGDQQSGTEPATQAGELARQWLENLLQPSLKAVFNCTGTVLHTNLGRAPMPPECIAAVASVAGGASNLEFDTGRGKRGDRDSHVERWLCRLTGAEAATVVNNNAAAVLLTLNSLASRRAVAVSRGELVEIGGSFRIPDIMRRAGSRLFEVGTTNRTHLHDFQQAIDEGVACVMRVHTSNYKIEGFTSSVTDKDLAAVSRKAGVLFINDLGSGALVDMTRWGLPAETTPAEALAAGANVVTFSGDKLLGGPQCGLIVGDRKSIDRIRKNPMKRALRCDKMTLAALEILLQFYADPERLRQRVPALRLLTRSADEIHEAASTVEPTLSVVLQDIATVTIEKTASQIGSGALPVDQLPSHALVVRPLNASGSALKKLSAQFRELPQPVIGRLHEGALWLDMRCIEDRHAFLSNLQLLKC